MTQSVQFLNVSERFENDLSISQEQVEVLEEKQW